MNLLSDFFIAILLPVLVSYFATKFFMWRLEMKQERELHDFVRETHEADRWD